MKKKILIILVVLLIAGGAAAYFLGVFDKNKSDEKAHSQLTGLEVDAESADQPVLGIMIENSQEARPQTGLDSAGIVFEAVTEGGITRYLALYQENMPEEVAPVRSLRTHFLDWAMGFDASIAHVGGNERALELVTSRDAKSLNQFKYSDPYYRSNDRAAPHNMHAKTADLRSLQKELGYKKSKFNDIPRSNDAPSQAPTAPQVTINYSGALYQVEFRYDQATNSYTRYLAGEPHLDSITNKPITVKNVIVLKLNKDNNAQEGGLGSGEALVFKDGNVIESRWEQENFKDRITITDSQDVEIPLNRGDTWFAALPSGRSVDY